MRQGRAGLEHAGAVCPPRIKAETNPQQIAAPPQPEEPDDEPARWRGRNPRQNPSGTILDLIIGIRNIKRKHCIVGLVEQLAGNVIFISVTLTTQRCGEIIIINVAHDSLQSV